MKKEDYGELKRMLLDEYMQENPSEEEINAFYTGLTWFEDALYDNDIDDELNNFFPMREENKYLREQLAGMHKILEDNMEMKRLIEGMENKVKNMMKMSKQELKEEKSKYEYANLLKENIELNKYKDKYFTLLAEKWLKEHPDIAAHIK